METNLIVAIIIFAAATAVILFFGIRACIACNDELKNDPRSLTKYERESLESAPTGIAVACTTLICIFGFVASCIANPQIIHPDYRREGELLSYSRVHAVEDDLYCDVDYLQEGHSGVIGDELVLILPRENAKKPYIVYGRKDGEDFTVLYLDESEYQALADSAERSQSESETEAKGGERGYA